MSELNDMTREELVQQVLRERGLRSDLLASTKQALTLLRSKGAGEPGWGVAKDILGEAIAKAGAA